MEVGVVRADENLLDEILGNDSASLHCAVAADFYHLPNLRADNEKRSAVQARNSVLSPPNTCCWKYRKAMKFFSPSLRFSATFCSPVSSPVRTTA